MLKSYYTSFLGDATLKESVGKAQERCRRTREQMLKEEVRGVWEVCLPTRRILLAEVKYLLLVPLLYWHPDSFGVEEGSELHKLCRDVLYVILRTPVIDSESIRVSEESATVVEEFLSRMSTYLREDREELSTPLFLHVYNIREARRVSPEDEEIVGLEKRLQEYVRAMNLEKELQAFIDDMDHQKEAVVTMTMEDAFFDLVAEDIETKTYTMFMNCVEELREFLEKNRPSFTKEQLDEVLDPVFIRQQLEHDLFDRERIENYFNRMETVCEIPVEPSYAAATTISKYVSERLRKLYAAIGI